MMIFVPKLRQGMAFRKNSAILCRRMTTLSRDTNPKAERVQIELMRRAPAWRKIQMVAQLNETIKTLALSGLRQRHPVASDGELRRLLADLILGETLATRVYGPIPKP